jgi:predicted nucleotidyltransferase
MAPEQELHGREIARRTGLDATGVMRELKLLERLGIVSSRPVGRRVMYTLNRASQIYEEMSSIIRKTAGLADVLCNALAPMSEKIELAYVYGSQATGQARPDSDVDVMVVGSVSSLEVYDAMERSSFLLKRAVNPTVYTPAVYWEKVKRGRGFPFTAHSGPRIQLMGEDHELE